MAKKIWCYTLSISGVQDLYDAGGVGDQIAVPKRYHVYECMDDNANLATDGTKPLFTSTSGVIDSQEIAAMQHKYDVSQNVSADFVVTCGTDGSGVGYNSFSPYGSIDHSNFDGVVLRAIDVINGELWVTFDAKPLHLHSLSLVIDSVKYDLSRVNNTIYTSTDAALTAKFVDAAVLNITLKENTALVVATNPADDPADDDCTNMTDEEICQLPLPNTKPELVKRANLLNIQTSGLNKADLIAAITNYCDNL